MRRSGLTLTTVVAISALTGCGGGGGGSGSRSTAAGVTPVRTMPAHRAAHTATLLPSGDVLIAGGLDVAGQPMASTVIITPTTVRSGPDMATPRVGHSATLLSSGEVLIAGGSSDTAGAAPLATSELFDPLTNAFTPGPTLAQARRQHVAASFTRATGEFVFIAGGQAGLSAAAVPAPILLDTVEVVDVTLGTSTAIAPRLAAAQADARVARLDTGGLLVVAGQTAAGSAPAQVFDPVGQTFTARNVIVGRAGAAVVSRGREVLVAGGQSTVGLEDSSEVYDSTTGTFTQGARLGAARRDAAIAAIGTNDVVVVGGRAAAGASGKVEKVSGATFGQAQVTALADLATAREKHTATAIGGTKFIVVGGIDAQGQALDTIETIDLTARPASSTTTPTSTSPTITPGTTGPMPLPTTPTMPTTPTTPPPSTSTPPSSGSGSSGGLGGFLSGLFGGGSSGSTSGGGGSLGSTLLNAAIQAAISALTTSSGSGFSGFLSAFIQNLLPNLISGLFGGGSGTSSSGSGLSGLLGSVLGGLTGGSGSGSSSSSTMGTLLSSLLGSLTGSGSGSSSGSSSSGLGGLFSSLLGGLTGGSSSGSTGSTGSSSSGIGGLFSSLLGGLFGGSGSTAPASTPAPSVSGMSPGAGPVGATVTITGANFSTTSISVTVNGRAAVILGGNTSTSVRFTVPGGATSGQVLLTSAGQTVSAGNFTVQ